MDKKIEKSLRQILENSVCTDLEVKCTIDIIVKLEDNTKLVNILMEGDMMNIHEYIFSGLVISMINASLAESMSKQSHGSLTLYKAHKIIVSFGSMIDIEKLSKTRED